MAKRTTKKATEAQDTAPVEETREGSAKEPETEPVKELSEAAEANEQNAPAEPEIQVYGPSQEVAKYSNRRETKLRNGTIERHN